MRRNTEIAQYLRYISDLHFANAALRGALKGSPLHVRAFALAKAADAIEALPSDRRNHVLARGYGTEHVTGSVLRDVVEFAASGRCCCYSTLKKDFSLPPDLASVAELPSLSVPLLFMLALKFDLQTKQDLYSKLPEIRRENELIYRRLSKALAKSYSISRRRSYEPRADC